MNDLRKLIFGETWLLPCGICVLVVVAGLILKPLLGDAWADAGGPIVLTGVIGLLTLSVRRGIYSRPSRERASI